MAETGQKGASADTKRHGCVAKGYDGALRVSLNWVVSARTQFVMQEE